MATISKKIAVCLVKFTENPDLEPDPVSYFEDLVIRDGADNLNGYIKFLSFGKVNLNGSRVFGWKKIPISAASLGRGRDEKINAVKPYFTELRTFAHDSCIFVFNTNTGDGGAWGNNVLCDYAPVNPHHRRMTFVAHELLHTFGLGHSHDDSGRKTDWQIGEYLDLYDIMSAERCYTFGEGTPIDRTNKYGNKGPVLNAPFLDYLGWLDANLVETVTLPITTVSKTVKLSSISTRDNITENTKLALRVLTNPDTESQLDDYWVEFRTQEQWDAGIRENNTVSIRRFKSHNSTYVLNKETGVQIERNQGDVFIDFKNNLRFEITEINPTDRYAMIKVGVLFNGSLRVSDANDFFENDVEGIGLATGSGKIVAALTINKIPEPTRDFDKAFFKLHKPPIQKKPFVDEHPLLIRGGSISSNIFLWGQKQTVKGKHPETLLDGWFGGSVSGGGIALADISNNGKDDVIVFHLDNPFNENFGYYRIGWDLNPADGSVTSWTNAIKIPGSFGIQNRGGSINLGNLKPSTKDIIVASIDQVFNEYHAVYRIGKNINTSGIAVDGWTGVIPIPAKGKILKNASAVITSLVTPTQKDILFYYTEEKDTISVGKFIIGWDIDANGLPRKGWSRTFELISQGWKPTPNQMSTITVRNNSNARPDLFLFSTVLNFDDTVNFGRVLIARGIGF